MIKGLPNKYIAAALGYSAIRKTTHVWDAKIETYDLKTRAYVQTPLLLTSKVHMITFHALSGIFMIPFYLEKDIQRLEIKLRGLNPSLYDIKKPTTYADYFFL